MPRTAFLFLDLQTILRAFIPPSVHPAFDAAVLKAKEVLEFARSLGPEQAVIIHVPVGGQPRNDDANYSVLATPTPRMKLLKSPLLTSVTTEDHKIVPELTPLPGEIVFLRPRVSAFHDTNLNATLRGLGVEQLVLSGVASRGIVLSTFVSAVDHDYLVTVIRDACADSDEELQRLLHENYFTQPQSGSKSVTFEEFKKEFKL